MREQGILLSLVAATSRCDKLNVTTSSWRTRDSAQHYGSSVTLYYNVNTSTERQYDSFKYRRHYFSDLYLYLLLDITTR